MTPFELIVLGNGGMVNRLLPHNGLVISKHVLMDCPPDVVNSFQNVGLETPNVRHVLISHFHADHTFGFPFVLLDRWIGGGFGSGSLTPLEIVGPIGTKAYLTTLVQMGLQPGHPALGWFDSNATIQEVEPGDTLTVGEFKVDIFPLKHIESSIGFTFTRSTDQVVFSYLTDTTWCVEVERELQKGPRFAWIDMNGGPSGLHASYEDTVTKGLAITGDRTMYLGTHVSVPRTTEEPRVKMVNQGDRFTINDHLSTLSENDSTSRPKEPPQ